MLCVFIVWVRTETLRSRALRLSCSQYTELEAFFWLEIERKSSKKYSVIVFVEKALSKTSCFEARLSSMNRKKTTDHTTCSHVLLSHVFIVLFCGKWVKLLREWNPNFFMDTFRNNFVLFVFVYTFFIYAKKKVHKPVDVFSPTN